MGKNYTDFNPRPTCVGRLGTFMATPMTANFNPRPTCVGRRKLSSRERVVKILQSTPHMRGATTIVATRTPTSQTSIHAPHAWGDQGSGRYRSSRRDFNPRPTCVGRRHHHHDGQGTRLTSIHAPHAWGDRKLRQCSLPFVTSIHAPHAWGDVTGRRCSTLAA